MSGQSANLTLKEAKAMQERVQASGSHAKTHGKSSSSSETMHKKESKKKEEC
jgi:hypothetical protein